MTNLLIQAPPSVKDGMVIDRRDMTDPVKRVKIIRQARAFNMAAAEQVGKLYNALVNGRATLGDSDDDGNREIVFENVGTGVKIDKEAARRLGITDWTEEREAREDTVL